MRRMFGEVAPRYDLLNRLLSLRIDQYWRRGGGSPRQALPRASASASDGPLLRHGRPPDSTRNRTPPARRRQWLPSTWGGFLLPHAGGGEGETRAPRHGCAAARSGRVAGPDGQRVSRLDHDCLWLSEPGELPQRHRGNVPLAGSGRLPGDTGVLTPEEPCLGPLFELYFRKVLPSIGNTISGSGDAYSYLQKSVERFLGPEELEAQMKSCGFERVEVVPLTAGISLLHLAYK